MEDLKKETIEQLKEVIKQKKPEDVPKIDALTRLLSTLLYNEREEKKTK